jgi:hypothetical protein
MPRRRRPIHRARIAGMASGRGRARRVVVRSKRRVPMRRRTPPPLASMSAYRAGAVRATHVGAAPIMVSASIAAIGAGAVVRRWSRERHRRAPVDDHHRGVERRQGKGGSCSALPGRQPGAGEESAGARGAAARAHAARGAAVTAAVHHVYVPWSGAAHDVCAEHLPEVIGVYEREEVHPAPAGAECEICAEAEREEEP